MLKHSAAVACICCAILRAAAANDAMVEGWVDVFERERARGAAPPALSDYIADLDFELAYAVQRALLRRQLPTRGLAGYYVLSAPDAPQNLISGLSGVLFADERRRNRAVLRLPRQHPLALQPAIGFVLRSPIQRTMKSVADLKTYIEQARAVVTLQRGAAATSDNPLDRIAVNSGAGPWITGPVLAPADLEELDGIGAAVYRDGETVAAVTPSGGEGHLARVLWLVNHLHAAGWSMAAGQVLTTPMTARLMPAPAGRYRVEFGPFGAVSFALSDRGVRAQRSPPTRGAGMAGAP